MSQTCYPDLSSFCLCAVPDVGRCVSPAAAQDLKEEQRGSSGGSLERHGMCPSGRICGEDDMPMPQAQQGGWM